MSKFYKNELFKESLSSFILQITSLFIGYIIVLFIVKNYNIKILGIYYIIFNFLDIAKFLPLLGFDQISIRIVPEFLANKHIKELEYILKKFILISFFISILMALFIWKYSDTLALYLLKSKHLSLIFKMVSIIFPFFVLNNFYCEIFRGMKKIVKNGIFNNLIIRIVFFLLLIISKNSDIHSFISYLVISIFINFILTSYWLIKELKEKKKNIINTNLSRKIKYFSISFTMFQSTVLALLSYYLPIFLFILYSDPSDFGIYKIDYQIAGIILIIAISINSIFAPKISETYYKNKKKFLVILKSGLNLYFFLSFLVGLFILITSKFLMNLFNIKSLLGVNILKILVVVNFINGLNYIGGNFLDVIGKEKYKRNILILNIFITIIVGIPLIKNYKALGLLSTFLIVATITLLFGFYITKELILIKYKNY